MTRRRSYICPHGLDLRVYPRCYVCDPVIKLPFDVTPWRPIGCTCPDIGDLPRYCPVHRPPYYPTVTTSGTNWPPVRCTCPPIRGDNYLGTCPIHDTQSTYTWQDS